MAPLFYVVSSEMILDGVLYELREPDRDLLIAPIHGVLQEVFRQFLAFQVVAIFRHNRSSTSRVRSEWPSQLRRCRHGHSQGP